MGRQQAPPASLGAASRFSAVVRQHLGNTWQSAAASRGSKGGARLLVHLLQDAAFERSLANVNLARLQLPSLVLGRRKGHNTKHEIQTFFFKKTNKQTNKQGSHLIKGVQLGVALLRNTQAQAL
jgi:hypothetical protein